MTIFAFFILLAFIICIFLAWFFSHRAKHKERMMLIEKGLATEEKVKEGSHFSFPWLKVGIIIVGLGIGLTIISFMAMSGWLQNASVMPLAILVVCGGISMVVANYINSGNHKP